MLQGWAVRTSIPSIAWRTRCAALAPERTLLRQMLTSVVTEFSTLSSSRSNTFYPIERPVGWKSSSDAARSSFSAEIGLQRVMCWPAGRALVSLANVSETTA